MPTCIHFAVSAICGGEICKATRRKRYSAMVLADRWAADAYHEVRITDPAGVIRSREAFRATLQGMRVRLIRN